MSIWTYVALPVIAAALGAVVATYRTPGPNVVSAIQHFTAGVVFAAAAGEILPDLKHHGYWPVLVGGGVGVVAMLLVTARPCWRTGRRTRQRSSGYLADRGYGLRGGPLYGSEALQSHESRESTRLHLGKLNPHWR